LGRKTCIVLGNIGQAIAFSSLVAMKSTEWFVLLYPTCMLYMVACNLGISASFPWMVETIPSVGIGMALGLKWFGTGCVGYFVPMMTEEWPGPFGTMIFFCFWCWVGIIALDWVIIETKGKRTDEIEKEYLHFKYRPFRLCPGNVVG
jgi:hypothetical protein